MSLLMIGMLLVSVAFLAMMAWLLRRLVTNARGEVSLARLESINLEFYRPLERLLADEDFEYLADQPGYKSRMSRHLRSQRRSIARQYIARIDADFETLHSVARRLLVGAPVDRAEFASALFHAKVSFEVSLFRVRTGLVLDAMGVSHADLRGLSTSLAQMRETMQALSPTPLALGSAA